MMGHEHGSAPDRDRRSGRQPQQTTTSPVLTIERLQQTAGNRATARLLSGATVPAVTVQRGIFSRLFGGKKKKDSLVIGGPKAGRPMAGTGTTAEDPYGSMKPELAWLNDPAWQRSFLAWCASQGQAEEKRISPTFLRVFHESRTANENKELTQGDALALLDNVIAPNMRDPMVTEFVRGKRGEGTLESLRTMLMASGVDAEGKPRWKHGWRVMEAKITGAYYLVSPAFQRYNETRAKDRSLDHPSLLPPQPKAGSLVRQPKAGAPPLPRMSPRSTQAYNRIARQGAQRHEEYTAKAKEKLRACGVPDQDVDSTLERVVAFIRDAQGTINLGGMSTAGAGKQLAKEFSLYERLGGRTPVWSAPKETQEKAYLDKRQQIEQKFFGFDDDPYQSGKAMDRPVYAAPNLGGAVTGAGDQWGTSYFVLKREVQERATYSHADTYNVTDSPPTTVTTAEHLEGVIADMPVAKLRTIVAQAMGQSPVRSLGQNQYLEMQIFGGVDFRQDIDYLVIDRAVVPAGSKLDFHIRRFARQYGIKIKVYNASRWKDIAGRTGVQEANQAETPQLSPPPVPSREGRPNLGGGGQDTQTQEVKVAVSEDAPGTRLQVQSDPRRRAVRIEKVLEVEEGSGRGGKVANLAKELEGRIKLGRPG